MRKTALLAAALFAACSGGTGTPPPEEVLAATYTHSLGTYDLAPFEEATPCLSWTIDNDEALYVNAVTVTNGGGWHHSNWYVVPDDNHEGPDGFFRCQDRNVDEALLAIEGTVLFAQSTQSRFETQKFGEGVAVKIPPYHRVIIGGHLLNLAGIEQTTELRVTLDLVHPKAVHTILGPFVLANLDLDIPANSEARFAADCELDAPYEQGVQEPWGMKVHYILPHYHYLGNYFDLSIFGGPRDGERLYRLEGFNAEANGHAFDPPVDLGDAKGLSFTCGYLNPRDARVGVGIGDQEMCMMFGLADYGAVLQASVLPGDNQVLGTQSGIVMHDGKCSAFALPRNEQQTLPSDVEIGGELYVPPGNQSDTVGVGDTCTDTPPGAAAGAEPTLARVAGVFQNSCTFSSCHGGSNPKMGLALDAADLHGELSNHTVGMVTDLPLVAPGDPEGSWLYQLLSRCEPVDGTGNVVPHMPLNSPKLLASGEVALVRDWIAGGARP